MKDVLISISGTQSSQDGDDEKIELVTDGQYQYGDEESWFTYNESSITGMEGTKTTFRVEKNKVTLTREGSVNSQMMFQFGKKHVFLYDTPYGTATMGVDTKSLKTETDEHGVKMDIIYSVDVDNIVLGKNVFKIDVREIKQ